MSKKYIVRLTEQERGDLRSLVKKGKAVAYKIRHANILLAADTGGPAWTDTRIAEAFSCHPRTVENVRRRFVLEGLEAALERKKQARPSRARKLDGEGEALSPGGLKSTSGLGWYIPHFACALQA